MKVTLPVHVEPDAVPGLLGYLASNGLQRLNLVADQNTYRVLGQRVAKALDAAGFDLNTIILTGDEIMAGEHYLVQVLLQAGDEERAYLAVGSGTITDIARFCSHRTRTRFISLPTAPSVDGYTSAGAPLVIGGLKQTIQCHTPEVIFADLNTLCAAPRPMTAAGFADMLGKYTSLADWKLDRLLWGAPYDEAIAQRGWRALQDCVQKAEEIGQATAEGIRSLMEALSESGLCMVEFGQSHPASGAEHYISHFWETQLLQQGRPAILHGAKVGVACVLVSRYWERIRQLDRSQAAALLQVSRLPDRQQEIERIRQAYGPIADQVIAQQARFVDMTADGFEELKQKVLDHWADIQAIAGEVPPSSLLEALLMTVGGPVDVQGLGLSRQEQDLALNASHYFRSRFTVIKLSRVLGLMP